VSSDPKAASPRPFDVQTIEHLIALMAQHDLSEISLSEGEQRIRLRKGIAPSMAGFMPSMPMMPQPTMGTPAPATPAEAPKPTKKYHEITSPMVGTFYSKPAPDKPDFIAVGSKVSTATVVCKVEAMKIFNDLAAEVNGTIVEICVKNGEPVDFGKVLFRVDPA